MTNFCKELMGFCIARGDFLLGGFRLGGILSGGILARGDFVRGDIVRGDFVLSPVTTLGQAQVATISEWPLYI